MGAAIEEWLQYMAPHLIQDLKTWTEAIRWTGDTKCILCKEDMGVCSYCFHEHITHLFMDKEKNLVNQFKRIFSLQLVAEN